MIAFLLSNWKWLAIALAFTALAGTASLFHVERDRARRDLEIATITIDRMRDLGNAQALATEQANAAAAAITERTKDALTAELAAATLRGDAVARQLRILAAAGRGCPLPGIASAARGAPVAPGAAGSEGTAADPLAGYTRACEADSARLKGWQDWWQELAALRP